MEQYRGLSVILTDIHKIQLYFTQCVVWWTTTGMGHKHRMVWLPPVPPMSRSKPLLWCDNSAL